MKKISILLFLGWLLINFRPVEAQTLGITMHEDWSSTLLAGQNCLDLQTMDGFTYDLIYLGHWNYNDHYQVEKRNASGAVVATATNDSAWIGIKMFCYNGKVLLTNPTGVSYSLKVKLYDQNLSLLKDTVWSAPWILPGEVRNKFYFDGLYLWMVSSGASNNLETVKLNKFDPIYLTDLGSLTIDSVKCNHLLTNDQLDYRFFIKYGNSLYLNAFKPVSGNNTIGRKFKINNDLQIVNNDPPVAGDLYLDLFPYNGSLYYLDYYNWATAKLIRKDTNGFSTSYQVNLPASNINNNLAIFPHGNIFLWGPGDGNIHKIDPANGAVISTKFIVNLPWTFDCSYYFGKIGSSPEYPFMVVGPTGTNPTEPFRIYLLDPITLDTLSTKVINSIAANYKIKEAGDKIYIFGNKIVELSVLVSVWPSFKIINGVAGQDVTNGSTILNLNTSAPPEVIFNANADSFWIKNVSAVAKPVMCKKIVINQVNNTVNCFSWDILYGATTFISGNPVNISPDSSFKSFTSRYEWNGHNGSTHIRYVFFDQNNINDSIWYDITYDITVGIEENYPTTIKVFPNPTADYLYIKGIVNPQIEIFNLLGDKLITAQTQKLNLSDLPVGLYYYRLSNATQTVLTGKLVKR
ncbi:MAG: T9SS type A sorting domain-containing protein [Candidatus Falkowbacteria bacterium]|nr:T9SS type A sorting domain-containing protein [Candidatus Falkowbacteria bacterium]